MCALDNSFGIGKGLDLQELDPYSITWSLTYQLLEMNVNTFREEPLFQIRWDPVNKIPGPEESKSSVRFSRIFRIGAIDMYLNLTDVNRRCFTLRKDNQLVGYIEWSLPDQLHTRPWFFLWLKRSVVEYVRAGLVYWYFGGERYPPLSPNQEWNEMEQRANVKLFGNADYLSPQQSEPNTDQLLNTTYPISEYMWCSRMCVHHEFQRQGLGQILMERAIKALPEYHTTVGRFQAPCKVGLNATFIGLPFYTKLGFRHIMTHEDEIFGRKIKLQFMDRFL